MSIWNRLLSAALLAAALSAAQAEDAATPVSPFTPTDPSVQTTSDLLNGTSSTQGKIAPAVICPKGCTYMWCPPPAMKCCNNITHLPCP